MHSSTREIERRKRQDMNRKLNQLERGFVAAGGLFFRVGKYGQLIQENATSLRTLEDKYRV